MKFQILSVFPSILESYLSQGVLAQAYKKKLFEYHFLNPRDEATDKYKSVDDRPFGGGDGMVMLPEILEASFKKRIFKEDYVIYLSPQGHPLNEEKVKQLQEKKQITLICGRYGGIDQRFINEYVDEEISLGDFVISGGELGALAILDSLIRKIPGALGNEDSAVEDSFANKNLEHPLFTRPQDWKGQKVPRVLLSGHHENIREWKNQLSHLVTLKKRRDLSTLGALELENLRKFFNAMSLEEKISCGLEDLGEF